MRRLVSISGKVRIGYNGKAYKSSGNFLKASPGAVRQTRILLSMVELVDMWKEFKAFAMKGNVMDLAIGVIIGGAFGKIVTSLVNDLLMPIFGILTGGRDFSALVYKVGDAEIKYGAFVQSVVDFLIIAVSIFLFIKFLGKFKRKQKDADKPAAPPEPSAEVKLLTEIRDLLNEQKQR